MSTINGTFIRQLTRAAALAVVSVTAVGGCSKESGGGPTTPSPAPSPTYDVDALGVPRIAAADYIDLSMIGRISRFRSSVGHDTHDALEACRSMKHYFEPMASVAWSEVSIQSPVQGSVTSTTQESAGLKVVIRPAAYPAFEFIIFHLNPSLTLAAGTLVSAGQALGRHIGSQTMSDIAVGVSTPRGYQLVSWFEAMTDGVFAGYAARGVESRASAIITRVERDGDPLTCSGEIFTSSGTGALPDWLALR